MGCARRGGVSGGGGGAYRGVGGFGRAGGATNLPMLQNLLRLPAFLEGAIDTRFIERHAAALSAADAVHQKLFHDSGARASGGPRRAGAQVDRSDPLAVLRESGLPAVGPLIDAFTFLAITTSFLGFVLGLSDFVADVIQASIPLHTSIFA